ncbi:hypothetical protein F6X40_09990 [Paraburkholderia sp. UCT31]|uniref:hypothetical protein n=1 Tax=Paraburkholderia sp. UCT31 TaxID=2615209 RepID=UPI00165562FF|nr:hypothetical protein [Paraburkholderia sp. UCT31]MBC8737137.1 hypothetical protein [Paraburkholderia sp. UCT31]
MKREHFHVTMNGEAIDVKYAYNSALRTIEATVRTVAQKRNEEFNLHASEGTKDEGGRYVTGMRVWRSPTTTLVFNVQKIG